MYQNNKHRCNVSKKVQFIKEIILILSYSIKKYHFYVLYIICFEWCIMMGVFVEKVNYVKSLPVICFSKNLIFYY